MTPLEHLLLARIDQDGPMKLSEYMAECLMHPKHGYYTQQKVFGRGGDFITSPGISQMFGEMLGLSLAQAWLGQGSPADAILVELGPGDGTLMSDIRRVAKAVPGFDKLAVHMVEQSPRLRDAQSAAVPGVTHHDTVATLPECPIFLVANEFFDALPIRQFQRTPTAWAECCVGQAGGKLSLGLAPPQLVPALDDRLDDTQSGDIVEHCPALPDIVRTVSTRINHHGGAALIIDYGDWRSRGDTVQAVRDHKSVGILKTPGQADLTAHVDFEAIAAHATTSAMTPQGVFLERLGITQRAQSLAAKLKGAALDQHIAAHRRLTHPSEMGKLFKVIGIAPSASLMPSGLAQ